MVLFEPRIAPNTGNMARTCAATNTVLHLIRPFGFEITDKHLKRAGLDYWDKVDIRYHDSLDDFMKSMEADAKLYLVSKFAEHVYSDVDYSDDTQNHYFLFGREDTGLPQEFMLEHRDECIRIPMNDTHVRALNVSNCACMIIYEAMRQQEFRGLELVHTYQNDKLK